LAKREFIVYISQTAKTFSSFTVISFRSHQGLFPVTIVFAKKFCAPHTTTPVFTLQNREKKQGKSENYIFKRFDSPRFLPF